MKTFLLICAAGCLPVAWAQAPADPAGPAGPKAPMRVEHDVLKMAGPTEGTFFERQVVSLNGADTVEFVSTEANFSGKPVKGAPYSAEAVTETSQTLSDGNRITKKSTVMTYRDNEGRTRREVSMPAIGPWSTQGEPPTLVVIQDPAAGVTYHLDTKTKTARKVPNFSAASFAPMGEAGVVRSRIPPDVKGPVTSVTIARPGIAAIPATPGIRVAVRDDNHALKADNLGKQTIDGVEAEGSRTTITIPAGEIGNEREIHVVSERWYSPELQVVLLSKHSDPRVGDTVHRLTNVRRAEPHPSLFQIPSDYKLQTPADYKLMEDDGPGRMLRKMEKREEE